ncbi:radical SAM protein [Desulfosarcina ovata subsp. sediminis]|uniref:Radical SAM protein n=1 Tax=Desulfosarcina ovata subsp. sediminis TaxID=885957 RepID=A0A5K7ZGL8_9BACT|nr:radical SAM protein [Desulfosarcina ovata]BBO80484.1 radical SAM protein [Desulfosarcina ovata subsp. sediminis]
MPKQNKDKDIYHGFEQGPIRPPSEAHSLLVRVTRNCPWNRCTFCHVYKESRFSVRSESHVIEDIEGIHRHVDTLRGLADESGSILRRDISAAVQDLAPHEQDLFSVALNWYAGGMSSIFLQDANSLIIKPDSLIRILDHLRRRFPWVERITSYARAHTVARISDDHLREMRVAGLNRLHMGLESGADSVLQMVCKGVDKQTQVKAGRKVKKAGIELSEYVMPGLGGKALWREHALETADALNQIDPDFIRLRSLAIPQGIPLAEDQRSGRFVKLGDTDTVREIRLFVATLDGITSMIASDHILNLFAEVEGRLPEAKAGILALLDRFLNLPDEERCRFQVGRRMGLFTRLEDMQRPKRRTKVDAFCTQHGITPDNVDHMIAQMMTRFI